VIQKKPSTVVEVTIQSDDEFPCAGLQPTRGFRERFLDTSEAVTCFKECHLNKVRNLTVMNERTPSNHTAPFPQKKRSN
jgi:hypothetical protein